MRGVKFEVENTKAFAHIGISCALHSTEPSSQDTEQFNQSLLHMPEKAAGVQSNEGLLMQPLKNFPVKRHK